MRLKARFVDWTQFVIPGQMVHCRYFLHRHALQGCVIETHLEQFCKPFGRESPVFFRQAVVFHFTGTESIFGERAYPRSNGFYQWERLMYNRSSGCTLHCYQLIPLLRKKSCAIWLPNLAAIFRSAIACPVLPRMAYAAPRIAYPSASFGFKAIALS